MMDQNIWVFLLLKFSATSLICFYLIKFANSAILKFNIAQGRAAFGLFFSKCDEQINNTFDNVCDKIGHLFMSQVLADSLKNNTLNFSRTQ